MDKAQLLQQMKAGEFIENNGRVLCTINILTEKYVKLSIVRYALTSVSDGDIVKSINFLEEEGYIHIRNIISKEKSSISDFTLDDLEAKLSGKGIRLLCGNIKDAAIRT